MASLIVICERFLLASSTQPLEITTILCAMGPRPLEQKQSFSYQNGEYEYRVGTSRFGLYLSRRKLGLEGFKQIEQVDKPSKRPEIYHEKSDIQALTEAMIKGFTTLSASIDELRYSINSRIFH